MVQMVIMVVRDDNSLDRWQLIDVDGRRVKPLRPGKLYRGCPVGEHWVGQPEGALQLHQYGRVAKTIDRIDCVVVRMPLSALSTAPAFQGTVRLEL